MSLNAQPVLTILALVPCGKLVSYGQLADLAGLPGKARWVGQVLQRQDTTQLPWHRVLASDGRLSLAKGSEGWQEQRQRLQAEGIILRGDRVPMAQYRWQPDLAALLMLMEY